MAFQPGYGRTAVPARSSLIATTLAVAAVVAAGVFGASFIRLTGTPHRYGQNWSEQLNLQFGGIPAAEVRAALAARAGRDRVRRGNYGRSGIGGQAIPAIGLDALRGRGFLTLLAGGPGHRGARALGEGTMRSLHLRLGQRVPVGPGRGPPDADRRRGHVRPVRPGQLGRDRSGHRRGGPGGGARCRRRLPAPGT